MHDYSESSVILYVSHCHLFCRKVSFGIEFTSRDPVFDEGIEFGYRNIDIDGEWIPLLFISPVTELEREEQISVGTISSPNSVNIRGYSVPFRIEGQSVEIQLKMCGDKVIQNNTLLAFRWLQTVVQSNTLNRSSQVYLDNVRLSINSSHVLFMDNFNDQGDIKWVHAVYYCIIN